MCEIINLNANCLLGILCSHFEKYMYQPSLSILSFCSRNGIDFCVKQAKTSDSLTWKFPPSNDPQKMCSNCFYGNLCEYVSDAIACLLLLVKITTKYFTIFIKKSFIIFLSFAAALCYQKLH